MAQQVIKLFPNDADYYAWVAAGMPADWQVPRTENVSGYIDPGSPGVPTPPVQPFLTADDMMQLANAIHDFEINVHDIDSQLQTQKFNNEFDKTQIEDARKKGLSATDDSMIARGLFQSSIRDAELFDIEASARLRKNFLDDGLRIATTQAEQKKRMMQSSLDDFKRAMDVKKVENAAAVGANQDPWQVEPVAPHFVAGTLPGTSAGSGQGPPPITVPDKPGASVKDPYASYTGDHPYYNAASTTANPGRPAALAPVKRSPAFKQTKPRVVRGHRQKPTRNRRKVRRVLSPRLSTYASYVPR